MYDGFAYSSMKLMLSCFYPVQTSSHPTRMPWKHRSCDRAFADVLCIDSGEMQFLPQHPPTPLALPPLPPPHPHSSQPRSTPHPHPPPFIAKQQETQLHPSILSDSALSERVPGIPAPSTRGAHNALGNSLDARANVSCNK